MVKFLFNSLFWKGLNMLASLGTGILLARLLSIEDRGEYAIFLSVITIYAIVINIGIPEGLVYLLQKKKENAKSYISYGVLTPLLIGAGLLLMRYLLLPFEIDIFYARNDSLFFKILICIFLGGYNTLFRYLILKDNRIPVYNLLSSIETIINPLLFLGLMYLNSFTLNNVISAYLISSCIAFVIHFVYVRNILIPNVTFSGLLNKSKIMEMYKITFPLFFLGMAGVFSTRFNLFILDYFHGAINVGLYAVAVIIPNLLLIIPNQIAVLIYPVASGFKNMDKLNQYGEKILRYVIFFCAFLVLVAGFVVPVMIPYIYGEKYATVIPIIYIILIGVFFNGLNTIFMNLLIARGVGNVLLYNSLITIFGGLILSVLVYYYSYSGTAITYAIVSTICCLVSYYKYRQLTNIKMSSLLIKPKDIVLIIRKVI